MPKKKGVDEKEEKSVQRKLAALAVITVVPSIILAYGIVKDTVVKNQIQKYINQEFKYDDTQVVSSKSDLETKQIEVALIGKVIGDDEIIKLTNKLKDYDLQSMHLKITQTEIEEGITEEEIAKLVQKELGKTEGTLFIGDKQTSGTSKTSESQDIKDKMLDIKVENSYDANEIVKDLKQKYSKLENVTITNNKTLTEETASTNQYQIYVNLKAKEKLSDTEKTEINTYLQSQLGNDIVMTIEE